MSKYKKIVYGLLSLVFCLVAVWFVYRSYGLYQQRLQAEAQMGGFTHTISEAASTDIVFQGKQYERNPSVKAFLCIGVDSSGDLEVKVASDGGQADGVYMIAYDAAATSIKIMMIPRDTMTPITLTDLSGKVLGKDIQHLTLAYAYGDGRELSCERLSEAVSELLGGLAIDGYLAMNTSMISELNDLAGGVTVHIDIDGMERRDPELVKGRDVKLTGKQAEIFVRYRDIEIDHSALTRMSQQQQYIEGYLQALQTQATKDDQVIVRLMNMIERRMITNMAKDQYLNIGKAVLYGGEKLGQEDILIIPGTGEVTDFYDEFHHDPEGTMQMVLDLFYREK